MIPPRLAAARLVTLLRRVIAIDTWGSPDLEWIDSTLRLMAVEAREPRPGGETVITRLADILVIQAIRSWIAKDPAARTGWLGALPDKQIGHAIALVHQEPARAWTVESLANEVAMSRSALPRASRSWSASRRCIMWLAGVCMSR